MLANAKEVVMPPVTDSGKEVAVVWLHGMQCKPEAYKTIAEEFQKSAAKEGLKAWVGVPEFLFDSPNPVEIGHEVKGMLKTLKKQGFSGDQVYLAAHSLSGVFSQDYAKSNPDLVKGTVLMGSVLLRK